MGFHGSFQDHGSQAGGAGLRSSTQQLRSQTVRERRVLSPQSITQRSQGPAQVVKSCTCSSDRVELSQTLKADR